MRMILSRTTAFKGEPIRATLKLYYRVNLRGDNGSKFPSFNGFWAQEIEQDAQPQRERYNGKVYQVAEGGDMIPCTWPPDTPGMWQWEEVQA